MAHGEGDVILFRRHSFKDVVLLKPSVDRDGEGVRVSGHTSFRYHPVPRDPLGMGTGCLVVYDVLLDLLQSTSSTTRHASTVRGESLATGR